MKKILKKDFETFIKEAKEILTDKGFIIEETNNYPYLSYNFNSFKYGWYKCHVNEDYSAFSFSIFGRFEDEKLAKEILLEYNGNVFSGKCNFHYNDIKGLNEFKNFIDQL